MRPWRIRLRLGLALAMSVVVVVVHGSRPRPHILSKRNPTYSALSASSLADLARLNSLDSNLDFGDPSTLLSRTLVPRPVASANLVRLQREFEQRFLRLGWHVERDTFLAKTPSGDERRFTNLIATHDVDAVRRFSLAAHLDSKEFPVGDAARDKFVGATDSAVPCAILYDVAESLTGWLDRRKEFVVRDRGGEEGFDARQAETLEIILFDGEEAFEEWSATDSIYGARHLVDEWSKPPPSSSSSSSYDNNKQQRQNESPSAVLVEPKTRLERVSHLVLLDLLGARNPVVRNFYANTAWLFDEFKHSEDKLYQAGLLPTAPSSSSSSSTSSSKDDKGKRERERFESFFVDRKGPQGWMGTIEDDHVPFLKRGVPVVHLISVPFPRVWHTIQDDASALDLDTIKSWALIVRLTVAEYLGLDPELSQTDDERTVTRGGRSGRDVEPGGHDDDADERRRARGNDRDEL
ncbi:hypothetical protein JCM3766R1_002510 [Sporobolomyces carnicolor]